MQEKKRKKLSQMKVVTSQDKGAKARQLSLFEYGLDENPDYSNAFSFLEALPRFFWGVPKRTPEGLLPPLEREFELDKVEYRMKIKPAIVDIYNPKLKKTEDKAVYPGVREEIIEDVLLKMLTSGHGAYLDENLGVRVSLYRMRKELKERGHNYTIRQIKESFSVMTNSTILFEPKDRPKEGRMEFSIISAYVLRTHEDVRTGKEQEYGYILFGDVFKEELKKAAFRMFNYTTSMKFKKPLARWIFKRIFSRFRQATIGKPFSIKATTILRWSGMTPRKQFRDNLRVIREALQELKDLNMITSWEEEAISDKDRKNKLADMKFHIKLHTNMITGIIKANKHSQNVRIEHAGLGLS